jgi:hypothetical protein
VPGRPSGDPPDTVNEPPQIRQPAQEPISLLSRVAPGSSCAELKIDRQITEPWTPLGVASRSYAAVGQDVQPAGVSAIGGRATLAGALSRHGHRRPGGGPLASLTALSGHCVDLPHAGEACRGCHPARPEHALPAEPCPAGDLPMARVLAL